LRLTQFTQDAGLGGRGKGKQEVDQSHQRSIGFGKPDIVGMCPQKKGYKEEARSFPNPKKKKTKQSHSIVRGSLSHTFVLEERKETTGQDITYT